MLAGGSGHVLVTSSFTVMWEVLEWWTETPPTVKMCVGVISSIQIELNIGPFLNMLFLFMIRL